MKNEEEETKRNNQWRNSERKINNNEKWNENEIRNIYNEAAAKYESNIAKEAK